MGIFTSLIKKESYLENSNWRKDLLSSEGLKLYFLAKEAIQAYCTDVGITKKREIAFDVERALKAFTERKYLEDEIEFINSLLSNNKKTIKKV